MHADTIIYHQCVGLHHHRLNLTNISAATCIWNANNVDEHSNEKREESVTESTDVQKGRRSSVHTMSSSAITNVTTSDALANALTTIATAN